MVKISSRLVNSGRFTGGATCAAAAVLSAGIFLAIGGCKNENATQEPPQTLYNADQFQPNDSSRALWQNVQRQVAQAARESSTLNVTDFDDANQLNEIGRAKVDAMTADRNDQPPIIYLDLPAAANNAAVQQRRAAVEQYLRENAAANSMAQNIQVRVGPNPDPSRNGLAVDGISRLARTESMPTQSGGGTGSSMTGTNVRSESR
jgi:hypothetical protein